MADIDINLFYNTYRLEAMERVLHSQGKRIEDELYPFMDSLYERLVPAQERGDIENRIAAENTDIQHGPSHRRGGIKLFRRGHKLHIVLLNSSIMLAKSRMERLIRSSL